MEYKEYGAKNNDIIILLHGGGLSWWNYIDEISLLENEFHIVIPILDGHSGSDTNFTSIESNAKMCIRDSVKIGQRIRAARLEKGYSQADLGALVGCSNNHMSHVEVGQTKVSLAMLLKLAFVLEKNFDYFLLDTPYAKCDSIIDDEIATKLKKCNVTTLITVGKLIDVLLSLIHI